MKLPRWLARLFSSGKDRAGEVGPAFIQGENPGVIVHRPSGFRFPERVGDFQGVGVHQYDEKGLDVSVGYNHSKVPLVAMTVYVYACSEGNPADFLAAHFVKCKEDVASVHAKLQLLLEEGARISPGGTVREGRRAAFAFDEQLGAATPPSRSELYLFVHRGFFIKYRVTYPRDVEAEADAAVRRFLDELAWP